MCGCGFSESVKQNAGIQYRYRVIGMLPINKEVPNPKYNPKCIISVLLDSPTIIETEVLDVTIDTFNNTHDTERLVDDLLDTMQQVQDKIEESLANGADSNQTTEVWGKTVANFTSFVGVDVVIEKWSEGVLVENSAIRVSGKDFQNKIRDYWNNTIVTVNDLYDTLKDFQIPAFDPNRASSGVIAEG